MGDSNTSAVESIFSWWQEVMNKPRARMDEKRRKAIAGRLRDGYTISDLCDAIAGCATSDFHMGRNDRETKYNDLELILRDACHVDGFIDRWEEIQGQDAVLKARKEEAGPSVAEMSPEQRKGAVQRIRDLIRSIK